MKNKTMIDFKSRRGFLKGITKWIGGTTLLAASTGLITSKEIKAASYRKSVLAEVTCLSLEV